MLYINVISSLGLKKINLSLSAGPGVWYESMALAKRISWFWFN
jgi:hypothetical protein